MVNKKNDEKDTRDISLPPPTVVSQSDGRLSLQEPGVEYCPDNKLATGKRKARRKPTRKLTPKAAILPQK